MNIKKILILAANPIKEAILRLDKEVEEIRTTLLLSPNRDRFVIESRGAVRPQDLQQHLFNLKPQILHFSGHGDRRFSRTLRDDFRCSRSIDFYRLPTSILNDRYIAANIEKTYQVI